jgi:GntR family transcriptional regulator
VDDSSILSQAFQARSRSLPGDDALPLYLRVQYDIEREMRSGAWAPPAVLPSEHELSQIYGVSRSTVRQALQRLATRGLVSRHAGRGSIALRRKTSVQLNRYISFSEDVQARGFVPGSRLLDVAVVPAEGLVAEGLDVPAGTPVLRLSRVRLADAVPVAYGNSYLRYDLVSGMEKDDLSSPTLSLHTYLKERFGVELVKSRATLLPALASETVAPLIEQPVGAPIFEMRSQNLIDDDQAAEYAHDYFRPDYYVIELRSS